VVKVDASKVESATGTAFTFTGGAGGGSASGIYTPTAPRQQYYYRVEGTKTGLSTVISSQSSATPALSYSLSVSSAYVTSIANASVGTAAETGYYLLSRVGVNTLRSGEKLVVYGTITSSGVTPSERALSAAYYAAVAGTPAGAAAYPTGTSSFSTPGYYFLSAGGSSNTVNITRVAIEKE
jgi:hypothetical protein